jgi:hypothetical protein
VTVPRPIDVIAGVRPPTTGGRIVWTGPRSEADLGLPSSAYLGHGAGDEDMVVA